MRALNIADSRDMCRATHKMVSAWLIHIVLPTAPPVVRFLHGHVFARHDCQPFLDMHVGDMYIPAVLLTFVSIAYFAHRFLHASQDTKNVLGLVGCECGSAEQLPAQRREWSIVFTV